jgi:hypothetical protein
VRRDAARLGDHHAALHFLPVDAAQQQSQIVSCLTFI